MSLFLRLIYARYLAASICALGVDLATFLLALNLLSAGLAAAAGYGAGMATHWLLSSRAVFAGRLAPEGVQRRQQWLLFLASGLVGLALTVAIVAAADSFGADPRMAKGVAILLSFQATYVLRRRVVFA